MLALQADLQPGKRGVAPRLTHADAGGAAQAGRASPERGEPDRRKELAGSADHG